MIQMHDDKQCDLKVFSEPAIFVIVLNGLAVGDAPYNVLFASIYSLI